LRIHSDNQTDERRDRRSAVLTRAGYDGPGPTRGRAVDTIRVASIPAGHVYVRHLSDPDGHDGVARLPDIPPADGARVPGGWWPPAMLDAGWVSANHATFDIFHVHFGFDARTPAELRALVSELREAAIPLVVTVHDLRNPHHPDPALHQAQLEILLQHAAAVVTLTPGAAEVIAERWGRIAEVLPHPHVVEPDEMAKPRPAHDGFVFGLHAKSMRANMDAPGVAAVLAEVVEDLPGARLRINVHHEVFQPGAHYYAPRAGAALRDLAAASDVVELREHDYFSDAELWDYLRGLDASVLPYRFGTHSGWLEACYDLGTAVVAPSCGFYAQQQPCASYVHDEDRLDADSLAAAARRVYEQRLAPRASILQRADERRLLAAAHRALYTRLLARAPCASD
jgi:glycosyltransferase involved in cell wall biosynthesis